MMRRMEGLFSLRMRRTITLIAAICGFVLYLMPGRSENGTPYKAMEATYSVTRTPETGNLPVRTVDFKEGMEWEAKKRSNSRKGTQNRFL